jgi:mono/diheme cytochrome c family protein
MVMVGVVVAGCLAVGSAAGAAEDGGAVYSAQCQKCHGTTGAGDTAVGKAMKIPSLVDPKYASKTPADLAAAIKANPKHGPILPKLTPEQIDAAAAKVKELAGATP